MKEPGSYLVYTIIVLDEDQIVKLDDPIKHGPADTQGDWGHFEVGGEKLRCREREGRRPGVIKDGDDAFCFHDLVRFPARNPFSEWEVAGPKDRRSSLQAS